MRAVGGDWYGVQTMPHQLSPWYMEVLIVESSLPTLTANISMRCLDLQDYSTVSTIIHYRSARAVDLSALFLPIRWAMEYWPSAFNGYKFRIIPFCLPGVGIWTLAFAQPILVHIDWFSHFHLCVGSKFLFSSWVELFSEDDDPNDHSLSIVDDLRCCFFERDLCIIGDLFLLPATLVPSSSMSRLTVFLICTFATRILELVPLLVYNFFFIWPISCLDAFSFVFEISVPPKRPLTHYHFEWKLSI